MAYIRKNIPNVKNIEIDGSEIRVDIWNLLVYLIILFQK
jgi:hypothetical protein